jgi:hypothetical protein
MVISDHPWGATFETEFRTTSCFLAGEDWNIKNYCNHDARSRCRDSKLSHCESLENMFVWICCQTCLFWYVGVSSKFCVLVSVWESGVCERVVCVCVCVLVRAFHTLYNNNNVDAASAFLFFRWFFFTEVTGNKNNDPRTQILWTFLRLCITLDAQKILHVI